MKVDTIPISHVRNASTSFMYICNTPAKTVFEAWSMSVRITSATPEYASSIPRSRMRWAMDCAAHTATALSFLVSNSWRLPSCTTPPEAPVIMVSTRPITSLTPHDNVFSRPMARYIGIIKNEAMKLVRATVLI